jgi:dolichol-phosphate mannosyltransferase
VYNEADSLEILVNEIREVASRHELHVQIVFVDDGSSDGSWAKIAFLAEQDPNIGGLRFHANSGKAAALMAGFAAARGELVFMMDADLQDPPEEIPRFIEKIDSGFDVVTGWKRERHDPWHKVYPSRVFNKMIGWVTGVHLHDNVCGFKCFRREVLKHIAIRGDQHRFLCVLAAANGFRFTEIPTLHRPRKHGGSKYGFTRFATGFLDLLTVWSQTRFKQRPQHLIGVTGLVLSALLMFTLVVSPILNLDWLWWFLTALLPAFVLASIGLVAEYVVSARSAHGVYSISEKVGWCTGRTELEEAESCSQTIV